MRSIRPLWAKQIAIARASEASSLSWVSGQRQMQTDHLCDLALVRTTVARDRVLDLGRGVLVDLQPLSGQYRQECATGLRQNHQRARVHTEKGGLEYRDFGLPASEESRELRGHVSQAIGHRFRSRTGEPAMGEGAQGSAVGLDQAVAGMSTAGV